MLNCHDNKQNRFAQLLFIFWILGVIVLYLFIKEMLILSLFPIYPDEIEERSLLSRLWFDFPILPLSIRLCKSAMRHMPFVWYFPNSVHWIVFGHLLSYKTLRVIGMINGAFFIVLLTIRLCYSNLRYCFSWHHKMLFVLIGFCFVISVLGMGVVPFALITNRPEQIILEFLVLILFLFYLPSRLLNTTFKKLMVTLAYFVCISIMLHAHAKTLYLSPIFILVGYRLFSQLSSKLWAMLCYAILLSLFVSNYIAWSNVFDCSNIPSINELFKSFNLNPVDIIQQPSLFYLEFKTRLLSFSKEIRQIIFQKQTDVGYLPPIDIASSIHFLNQFLIVNYLVIFFLLTYSLLRGYWHDLRNRNILSDNLLFLTVLFCACVAQALCNTKNWYDAAYFWSEVVIICIFSIAQHIKYLLNIRLTYVIVAYFLIVGAWSTNVLIDNYGPYFKLGWKGPSVVQLHDYNYLNEEADLKKITTACHINLNTAKNLIIDDATYLHFQKTKYPIGFTYLFMSVDPLQIIDPLLSKYHFEGMIIWSGYGQLRGKEYGIREGRYICFTSTNVSRVLYLVAAELHRNHFVSR